MISASTAKKRTEENRKKRLNILKDRCSDLDSKINNASENCEFQINYYIFDKLFARIDVDIFCKYLQNLGYEVDKIKNGEELQISWH